MKLNIRYYLYIIGLALLPLAASASDLTIPNTFVAGQPAIADEVNTNFSATESAVDDNHARVSALEATASGIDFASSDSALDISTIPTAPTVALSVTVTSPGPGFIKVDFSSYLVIIHTTGATSSVVCAIKTDTSSVENSTNRLSGTRRYSYVPSSSPTSNYYPHIDTFGIYPVAAAGSVTFYALCSLKNNGGVLLNYRSMAATFYGNRY